MSRSSNRLLLMNKVFDSGQQNKSRTLFKVSSLQELSNILTITHSKKNSDKF